jgi:ATP-binding cassette subfamily B protein
MSSDRSPRILARVFAYLRRYPLLAGATLLCALGSSVMVIVFPVVTQRIVDDVLRGGNIEALWPMIALAAVGFLAQDGLNTLRILLNNTFEQKVLFDLRSDLYARLQSLPLAWFDHRATGDIMTRVVEDVNNVELNRVRSPSCKSPSSSSSCSGGARRSPSAPSPPSRSSSPARSPTP